MSTGIFDETQCSSDTSADTMLPTAAWLIAAFTSVALGAPVAHRGPRQFDESLDLDKHFFEGVFDDSLDMERLFGYIEQTTSSPAHANSFILGGGAKLSLIQEIASEMYGIHTTQCIADDESTDNAILVEVDMNAVAPLQKDLECNMMRTVDNVYIVACKTADASCVFYCL